MELDNQQGTLSLVDIGWLAGLIDGDGHVILGRTEHRHGKFQYQPKVGIVNTSHPLIEKAGEVLDAMGVGYYICTRKPQKKRIRYTLDVSGFKRCAKLLVNVTPYLRSYKYERALLVLGFIQHRSIMRRAAPYTEAAEAFYEAVKACDGVTMPPRDQMPNAKELAKLESDLHGNMQRQAEMTCPPVAINFGWKEIWVPCEECGSLFRVSPVRLERNPHWCSEDCRRAAGYIK